MVLDLFLVLVSHRGPQRPQLSPQPCACNLCQSPPFSLYGQGEDLGSSAQGVTQSLAGWFRTQTQDRTLRLLVDTARLSFTSMLLLPGVTLGQQEVQRGLAAAEGSETCLVQPPFCRWGKPRI